MSAASMFVVASQMLTPPPLRYPTPGALGQALDPGTRQSPVLNLLDRELVSLVHDPDTPDRLMFFMPPQEGKSQRVSRRFVTWMLAQDPTLRIGIVSYELESAVRWGRAVKRDIEANPDLGVTLTKDSRAAGRWETSRGGGVYCVGIKGALTGKPLDVLVIDDPVKDRASAESKQLRQRAWEFWEEVGQLRLSARAKVVLIMTRWHNDDLAGRLLEHEPEQWRVVSVPGIAEADDDPLGRAPGEELVSVQGRTPGYFTKLRERMSRYAWLALFQQRPSAAEGNLFKRGDWRYWRHLPTDIHQGPRIVVNEQPFRLRECTKFITVDLATSLRTSADYTVAAAWAITPLGDLALLGLARDRVVDSDHFALVAPLRSRWLEPYDVVYVESRMFGTTFVYQAGREGIPIQELEADVDKITRALPAANLVRQHRVHLPEDCEWLDDWMSEMAEFPKATHDDQVDVLAYAARILVAHWLEPADTPIAPPSTASRDDGDNLDLMRVAF